MSWPKKLDEPMTMAEVKAILDRGVKMTPRRFAFAVYGEAESGKPIVSVLVTLSKADREAMRLAGLGYTTKVLEMIPNPNDKGSAGTGRDRHW